MREEKYLVVNKFNCCGRSMVTVIIKDKAACVMSEWEYNMIIEAERKFSKKDKLNESA